MTELGGIFFRILLAFALFTAILALVMGTVAYFSTLDLSEELLARRSALLLETLIQAEKFQRDGKEERLEADRLIAALNLDFLVGKQIPEQYQKLPDGLTVFEESGSFIFLKRDAGIEYALYGPAGQRKAFFERIGKMFIILAGLGLLVAIFLSLYLSSRLSRPIRKLTSLLNLAQSAKELKFPQALLRRQDEIGVLARAIDDYQQKAAEYIEREKFFTRAASHELRTPLTVISQALEILDGKIPVDGKERELLQRLERTCSGMEATVTELLCLARNESSNSGILDVKAIFNKVLGDFMAADTENVLKNPDFDRGKIKLASGKIARLHSRKLLASGNERLAEAVFRNLLENAVLYSEDDEIFINFTEESIEIQNTCSVSKGSGEGSRFGLLIARRACERMKWRLLQSGEKNKTIFTIILPSASAE